MNKFWNILVLILGMIGITFSLQAQLEEGCYQLQPSFQVGEKLEYKVYYNWKAVWMGAGKATFEMKEATLEDGRSVLHAYAEGKTLKRYNWFYRVEDFYQSYLHPETYQPIHFIRDISEGNYTKELEYVFDHDDGEVWIDYVIRKGKLRRKDETHSINNCTFDLLSIVYHTRNLDYTQIAVNDSVPLNLFMDGKNYQVGLQYLGKDTLETEHGTFRCIKIAPILIDGYIFDASEQMVIWATDDANKIPLLIESPLKVGAVKAYLKKYENLMYDLDARLDL